MIRRQEKFGLPNTATGIVHNIFQNSINIFVFFWFYENDHAILWKN